MKETLAELERWGADVIFGRAKGFRASMMRLAIEPALLAFAATARPDPAERSTASAGASSTTSGPSSSAWGT